MKNQTVYILDARMIQYAEGQEIMRRVAVLGNKSLSHLAEVILSAFDFECDHCYGFYGDVTKHPGREQTEVYELFVDAGEETIAENARGVQKTKISSVFAGPGKKMLFVFDYGDDWRFEVELKEVREQFSAERLPNVLTSIGMAPPQYPALEEE